MIATKKMATYWAFCLLFLGLHQTIYAVSPAKQISSSQIPVEEIQRFSTAIGQIKSYYVEPVKDDELFEDAIRGMLSGLDPHSSYLDIDDFSDLRASTSGEFGGLGIEVGMEHGVIKVISPIDDTPAARAGIKAGDLVVKIDGRPVKGLTLRDAVKKMRGKKGTDIHLTVLRKNEKKPLSITMKRDIIHIQSVKSRLLSNGYGYVRVSHFQAPTAKSVNEAVLSLRKQSDGNLQGIVLDVRNNPGGLLDAAIDVSDSFLDSNKKMTNESLIVYTKGRIPGSNFKAKANPGDLMLGKPMVVLINEGSASASEIVAGALQDHKRAVVVGTKSFGKGSVQTILPLDNKRGVKLTTALYYTPSGRSIQAKGISPDVVVEEIKLPKASGEGEDDMLLFLKEADLDGHLGNGNGQGDKAKQKAGDKQEQHKKGIELAREDYQLYQALTILQGLVALQQ